MKRLDKFIVWFNSLLGLFFKFNMIFLVLGLVFKSFKIDLVIFLLKLFIFIYR